MNQQNIEIAQKMLDILPLVIRVMAGEIRAADHGAAAIVAMN